MSAFGVVIIHVSAYIITSEKVNTYPWWIGNFFDSYVRWCVPIFVLISGYLILEPYKDENTYAFLKKRFQRIAIPLVFWSTIYLLYRFKVKNGFLI